LKKLALIALLLSTAAYAEDQTAPAGMPQAVATAPEPAKTPVANPVTVTPAPTSFVFVLDSSDMNTLAEAIGELKQKVAAPFLAKLQSQAQNQAAIISQIKAQPTK